MKKIKLSFIVFIFFLILTSCSKETEQVIHIIGDSDYIDDALPKEENSNLSIDTIKGSNKVVNGGSSFATIYTGKSNDSIVINLGVKDYNGYYKVRGMTNNNGQIPIIINYNAELPKRFTLQYSIYNEGKNGKIKEFDVEEIKVEKNQIQINLSWDMNNDLDLHLVTPSGKKIYYKNPGYTYPQNFEDSLKKLSAIERNNIPQSILNNKRIPDPIGIMLDVDSNPGCDIDGINSENISIFDLKLLEKGHYKVIANLYDQCLSEKITNFIVTVKKDGKFLDMISGKNPYIGKKLGKEGDNEVIMTFDIK